MNESASTVRYKASEYGGNHTYLDITCDDSCPYHYSADFNNDCMVGIDDLEYLCQF